ncbi:MAG: glycosyl hydrolase [Gemmatimonadetes bacterium]|nr:glycosyl hydrolase [Gemmatimonadota bacterium]
MRYRMIGPHRGGRSTAVAGIAEQPETYFMGSTGGGVWRTDNAGEPWANVSDGFFAAGSIGAIDVADSDRHVIYVGTGSACIRGNVSTGRGLYRSVDGGKTWTFAGLRDAGQIGDIIVHPRDANVVYVAALGHAFGPSSERGVFRSRDGGKTWEKVLFISDSTGFVDLAMNPRNPRELYATAWRAERKPWVIISGAQEGGLWKSVDGGDTWGKLGGGLPTALVGKIGVAVSPADPERVWALIEAPDGKGGIYRSEDAGETWTQVNTDRDLQQRAFYFMHIEADPQDPSTLYVMNGGLYRSVDAGKTFQPVQVPHGDVHGLWINLLDPRKMIVANDGGAQVTLDGAETWSTMLNQPTAELYAVAVDNLFPYRVYGAQQDNSTITVPSWTAAGIDPIQFWYSVGGCETGPVALHPDHPNLIYAGCYGGVIERANLETQEVRRVMVYPQLQLGTPAKDLRERFQWNSPIVVSPHDPKVVYQASQRIHRSTDGGMTWETISPDLTTNNPAHQECGGRPITCEGSGVEIYNTVFALVVSPHSPETLWAGTDDGRIHVTRDGGRTWTELTPPEMPPLGTVNRIEVSPHRPGKVYLAVHRYRLDDFRPYVFKTEDSGGSWKLLTDGRNGIPADHPVRVVREDPDREGLLYAGTEFGLFVSFDDGAHWQSLQLNLPVTPITDLKVHRRDLVVATQGRSFWILDDLTPLHQLTREVAAARRHLFTPRDAHRVSGRRLRTGRWPENPPSGAVIYYYFAGEPTGEVTLEILDERGQVVRRFSGRAKAETAQARQSRGAPGPDTNASADAGANRFVWDLMTEPVRVVEGATSGTDGGYTGGVKVVPGTYQVHLSAGDWSQTRPFRVLKDSRLADVTQANLEEQYHLALAIRDTLNRVYDAIRRIRSVREQLKHVARRLAEAGGADNKSLTAPADSIAEKLTAIEEGLIQTKSESPLDPINFQPRLDHQMGYLYGSVTSPDGRPTRGAYQRFEDVNREWATLSSRLEEVIARDIAGFNALLRERAVPSIIVSRQGG